MINHCEIYNRSSSQYPPGPLFLRKRYDERGITGNGLYLYAEGASGPCIGLYQRKNSKYPWKVYVGPFRKKGQKDEHSFKSFRNAVKLFRSLGRQALKGKIL